MPRMSTRGEYCDRDILTNPAFVACLEDSRPRIATYRLFMDWVDGSSIPDIAKVFEMSKYNVANHIQRTKAIYNIFAGRGITKHWEDYGLRRIVAVRTELWRSNQNANGRQLAIATNAFNAYYEGIKQDPKWLLAITTEEGIDRIPFVGRGCEKIFQKAKAQAVTELMFDGHMEELKKLMDLQKLIRNAMPNDKEPTDLVIARLMDLGIFDEDSFYRNGWEAIIQTGKEDWGISPDVLRKAYRDILKKMHPDVDRPMMVLISKSNKHGSRMTMQKLFGVSEYRFAELMDKLKKDGWKVAVGGRSFMPVRLVYVLKGDDGE